MQDERTPKNKLKKRTIVSIILILIVIPLTIYFNWYFSDGSVPSGGRIYLLSLIIIVCTMIPFFMVFEKRKPQARELVVIAVMCAIAVASRAAFIALPHFKPLVAFVIITGISFGPEAGFLCGAVSGFVSNFIFGQGPWTPWQMFAFGIAGYLAGFIFANSEKRKRKWLLSIFSFVILVTFVGPILDLSMIFISPAVASHASVLAIFVAGIPVNIIHGSAVFLAMLFFSQPMFEKLDRIKMKYGMLDEYNKI